MGIFPDEGKVLPPPGIVNWASAWMGGCGWCAAMLENAIRNRPPLKSGIHRQVLHATIGWFVGYHLLKYAKYVYAKRDLEMKEYARHHPEDFPLKKKQTFSEIVEPFHPLR